MSYPTCTGKSSYVATGGRLSNDTAGCLKVNFTTYSCPCISNGVSAGSSSNSNIARYNQSSNSGNNSGTDSSSSYVHISRRGTCGGKN